MTGRMVIADINGTDLAHKTLPHMRIMIMSDVLAHNLGAKILGSAE